MYELAGVRVDRIVEREEQIIVEATAAAKASRCPMCGQQSARVHCTYVRTLRDLPACSRPVRVQLRVRR